MPPASWMSPTAPRRVTFLEKTSIIRTEGPSPTTTTLASAASRSTPMAVNCEKRAFAPTAEFTEGPETPSWPASSSSVLVCRNIRYTAVEVVKKTVLASNDAVTAVMRRGSSSGWSLGVMPHSANCSGISMEDTTQSKVDRPAPGEIGLVPRGHVRTSPTALADCEMSGQ